MPAEASPAPVEEIAALLEHLGWEAAVAESLTGGLLSNRLAAAPGAGEWFKGGLVAYGRQAKQDLLGVPEGPVVSETAVRHMARGASALFHARCVVAVTGAGGPEGQDGAAPGTVWFAWRLEGTEVVERRQFEGAPGTICELACETAVGRLRTLLAQRWEAAGP